MIRIALVALNEQEYLPQTLNCLKRQTVPFKLYICVNQPEAWWHTEQRNICENNAATLTYLKSIQDLDLTVLDHSSPGKGWDSKNYGVGQARKTVMDAIAQESPPEDIILTLDADTTFPDHYLKSIYDTFQNFDFKALAIPYYHKLTGKTAEDQAILRYEIYMRNYALNMFRIHSPYRFTAIGSAMACTVKNYLAVGGITPFKSGEDFYFMQKMCKFGRIHLWNEACIYPQARFSNRVFFGTGPAMINGNSGDWSSYPIYHYTLFDIIKATYDLIPKLFTEDCENEFIDFLKEQFKTSDLWSKLRLNFKTLPLFTKAFHEKADALRILQFLKEKQKTLSLSDEICLEENFRVLFNETAQDKSLSDIREYLFVREMEARSRVVS